jgi:hypothetical protein
MTAAFETLGWIDQFPIYCVSLHFKLSPARRDLQEKTVRFQNLIYVTVILTRSKDPYIEKMLGDVCAVKQF